MCKEERVIAKHVSILITRLDYIIENTRSTSKPHKKALIQRKILDFFSSRNHCNLFDIRIMMEVITHELQDTPQTSLYELQILTRLYSRVIKELGE